MSIFPDEELPTIGFRGNQKIIIQPNKENTMKTKKIIEAYGICQIFVHKYDNDITEYSVEISGIQIFRCSSLENCYTRANSINSSNPISSTVDVLRAKGE